MATTLTITLTDRPPVKINKDNWPILARATSEKHDGQVKCQSNRQHDWALTVRQHEDGRSIVYGVYAYESRWQGEQWQNIRGGEMLAPGADLVAAIKRVAEDLADRCDEDAGRHFAQLAHECIADLPAEEI